MDKTAEKDRRILDLLDQLRSKLGDGAFDIVDHWEQDLIAVGIASPRNHQILVYIGVYDDGYHAELELPPVTEDDGRYRVAGRYSGLSFDQLANIVDTHFAQESIT